MENKKEIINLKTKKFQKRASKILDHHEAKVMDIEAKRDEILENLSPNFLEGILPCIGACFEILSHYAEEEVFDDYELLEKTVNMLEHKRKMSLLKDIFEEYNSIDD
ncbi:MAG: hypothetical protein JJT76_18740 [Clostridiaceae bacterium]|nr:hypothetical protein [Clostridiaceae bacterium]